jgi:hypothetical protein
LLPGRFDLAVPDVEQVRRLPLVRLGPRHGGRTRGDL